MRTPQKYNPRLWRAPLRAIAKICCDMIRQIADYRKRRCYVFCHCYFFCLPSFWQAYVTLNPESFALVSLGVPAILDPATTQDDADRFLYPQIFETLVRFRDGGTEIEPGLATSWQPSRDGLTWSFRLRTNVRFHDGTAPDRGPCRSCPRTTHRAGSPASPEPTTPLDQSPGRRLGHRTGREANGPYHGLDRVG